LPYGELRHSLVSTPRGACSNSPHVGSARQGLWASPRAADQLRPAGHTGLLHDRRPDSSLLSCLHQPIQPKSLRWWGKVGNSLILQHPPSRAGSPRPHTWILEWAVIILINAPARIRTRDLWLRYHIELHAPTNSSKKLKLMRKVGNSLILQHSPPVGSLYLLPDHPFLSLSPSSSSSLMGYCCDVCWPILFSYNFIDWLWRCIPHIYREGS
jgi:hypothetical protein